MFDEVAEYIIEFYPDLVSPAESQARQWLLFPGHAKEPRELPVDPNAVALIKLGPEQLHIHIRDRVVRDHGSELIFNRCPQCRRVVRTPLPTTWFLR